MLIISGCSSLYILIILGAALAGIDTTGLIALDVVASAINMLITTVLIIAYQNRRYVCFQWKGIFDPTPSRVRIARALMLIPLLGIVILYIALRSAYAHKEYESYVATSMFLFIALFLAILNLLSCGLGVDKVIPSIVLSFMENPFSAGYQTLTKHGRHSLR